MNRVLGGRSCVLGEVCFMGLILRRWGGICGILK